MKGRRVLTAADYAARLAKAERREDELLDRILRALQALKKTRAKARYFRTKITERS